MGCFGYICKGCSTAIRGNCFTGGEKCVLIYVHKGKELGRIEGHYDEYGGIIEQKSHEKLIYEYSSNSGLEFKYADNSGVAAYHSTCIKKAVKNGSFNLIPSNSDPYQSWGKIRRRFT